TVIATPGHTLGHASLYLTRTRTLISGDALTSSEGTLNGPMEMATPDMATARASVRRLAEIEVKQIVTYHGGLVDHDATGQLRRLAAEEFLKKAKG
ncbi:MAG TPA: MBL fold metallo-hydrolase, partial [Fimbriimonadaceae bacterium]|nr:MBL fold metallo-hydrolase [Fimbriimonadaceae bacterium]